VNHMPSDIEVADIQNKIIKMQSDVIYELYSILLENKYMTAEEADASEITKKINLVAQLKDCID